MTYSVYQHWDPLKVCVVGRSYPPEFYSWIKVPKVRSLFEQIATETEEDYQNIIKTLEKFNVTVVRTNIPQDPMLHNGQWMKPPMTPRDDIVVIGDKFFYRDHDFFPNFYQNVKDAGWPDCRSLQDFFQLPNSIIDECFKDHDLQHLIDDQTTRNMAFQVQYHDVFSMVASQNNQMEGTDQPYLNGAMVSRIGRDLYVGTESYDADTTVVKEYLDNKFPHTRNHVINTGGHSDSTYCPVCPGLIISLKDIPTYEDTFPGWEVVYLPGQSWDQVRPFLDLKKRNKGKWWIPGFEYDTQVIDLVTTWLDHWTGYVEETVFDVNMLIIDPKNVIVFNYNKQVFDALERYGITPHIVPFRHRYFWDGGIHCVTSDLHREGTMQDYFPHRN